MSQPLAVLDEATLIKKTLAGETEYFGILIDRHMVALKKCVGSMVRNGADADDLLQSVLLKVWRRLSTFRSESSFRTWMTRVAINEVLQSYRRDQRDPLLQSGGELEDLSSCDESPQRRLLRVEVTNTVRGAVAVLPEMYRKVLILRDLEEFSTEETAKSLRATVPAVKTRLFRARLMLSAALAGSKVRGVTGLRRKRPPAVRYGASIAA